MRKLLLLFAALMTATGMNLYAEDYLITGYTEEPDSIKNITLVAINTQYDGLNHNIQVNGIIAGDVVTYSTDSATWTQDTIKLKNAGEQTIYVRIQRQDHYDWNGKSSITITTKLLIVSGTNVSDKTYDGSTNAEVTAGVLEGIIGSDDVSIATATGVFANKNAGENKDVAVSYTLSGADKDNYSIESTQSSADIKKREITLKSADLEKPYDGTAITAYSKAGGTTITDATAGLPNKGYVDGECLDYSFSGSQLGIGVSDNSFTVSSNSSTDANNYNVTKRFGKLDVYNSIYPEIVGMYDKWNIVLNHTALIDTLAKVGVEAEINPDNVNWYIINGDKDEVDPVNGTMQDDIKAIPFTGLFHTEDKAMNGQYYAVVYVPEAQEIMGISIFQSNVVFIDTPAPTSPIRKQIMNGQLIIIRDDEMYNAQGHEL